MLFHITDAQQRLLRQMEADIVKGMNEAADSIEREAFTPGGDGVTLRTRIRVSGVASRAQGVTDLLACVPHLSDVFFSKDGRFDNAMDRLKDAVLQHA